MLLKIRLQVCWQKWISRLLFIQLATIITGLQETNAQGTLSGTNMAEFQLGNIPGQKPTNQSSLYDQLNVTYSWNQINLKTRIEQYYPSFGENLEYTRLSQYQMNYTTRKLDITVGHFYSILGRGLLLRTYEIPGSIWETRGYRVRYGFYRDITGFEVNYRIKHFNIKLLRGEVLDVALPPTLEGETERRPDLVEGGQLSYEFGKQKAGLIYLRNTHSSVSTGYASFFYSGHILKHFSLYGEFATRTDSLGAFFSQSSNTHFAAYASVGYTYKRLGISLEVKKYQHFYLGSGINDPPSLVKEHSYRLLNRSTHVPLLNHESGYQIEVYYRFTNNSFLTINHSSATNQFSSGKSPVFREAFADYRFSAGQNISSHIYLDYATDPLVNEMNRYSGGFILNIDHPHSGSLIEAGIQHIERVTTVTKKFINTYLSYTFSGTSRYSVSIITEMTNDPVHIEEDKRYNLYPAVSLQYHPDNRNNIILFYGKRRGGPACNSGICYDVLDFQGLELRLTTRL